MGGGNLGIWGPVTATLDWCEANYQFTEYVAECANTFSNFITLAFAIYGARSIVQQSLPTRYLTSFAGLALVGIGSLAFHATLLYEAQMADELPMIYSASWTLFVILESEPGYEHMSPYGYTLLACTLLFNVLFTYSYYLYRSPVYHQIIFASLLVLSASRTVYLTRLSPTAKLLPEYKRKEAVSLFTTGAGLFAFGFFIWNLDNIFCGTLTTWKHAVGWPSAFLLEGHSWWHIFTGAGTYFMLQGNTYLSLCIKDDPNKFDIQYNAGLPIVRRVKKRND